MNKFQKQTCISRLDPNKKKEERGFLKALILTEPAIFDLPWEDHESPDFKARTSKGVVGLELVRYFHPVQLVAAEKYIEKVRQQCIDRSAVKQIPDCLISVDIIPERWPASYDIENLALSLVEFVRTHLPEPGQGVSIGFSEIPEIAVRHGAVRINVARASTPRRSPFWSFAQFGGLHRLDATHLRHLVCKKNARLAKYRSMFVRAWLVIVGETSGLSSFAVVPDATQFRDVQSDFDRAWFFTLSSRRLVELGSPGGPPGP